MRYIVHEAFDDAIIGWCPKNAVIELDDDRAKNLLTLGMISPIAEEKKDTKEEIKKVEAVVDKKKVKNKR